MQELTLEKRCAQLKAHHIVQVLYYGHVQHHAHAHGVSKAIYFRLSDGSLHRIGFADEFHLRWGQGITIKKVIRVFPDDDEEQLYDATHDWLRWGKQNLHIKDNKIHWRYIADSHFVLWHYYSRNDYPQDIEFIFSDNRNIFIGATKIISETETKLFTNHLTVFFSSAYRQTCYTHVAKH